MKTTTYLRVSLVIPFLVWGICLLIFVATNAAPDPSHGSVLNYLFVFFVFYIFGIIGWFLPYLLLSLLLLILSFRLRAQTLMKVFALSPIAMALLIILFVVAVLGGSQNPGPLAPDLAGTAGEFLGSPAWFGILTLVWGYMCVVLGLGVYRLLQTLHVIREAETPSIPVVSVTASTLER